MTQERESFYCGYCCNHCSYSQEDGTCSKKMEQECSKLHEEGTAPCQLIEAEERRVRGE